MTEVHAKGSLVLNVWAGYGRLFGSAIAAEWANVLSGVCHQFQVSLWNPAGSLMILPQLWWANLSLRLQSQFWKGLQSRALSLGAAVPATDTHLSRSSSRLASSFWMELRLMSPRISLLALLCHLQQIHCQYRMLFAASGDNECPWFAVSWGAAFQALLPRCTPLQEWQ